MTTTIPADFYARHEETLRRALQAIREREYWSAFPEAPSPKVYGETAVEDGRAAFEAHVGSDFPLTVPGSAGWVSTERSPYGIAVDVRYPHVSDLDALLAAAQAGMPAWRDAGPDARAGICIEILQRINQRSFELASAVMHTTGQAFLMAFQAAGPHAQDRALEAIAYAYAEMTRHAAQARWTKPQGKREPLAMDKRFTVVPRGVSLVIGCNTFPTWNSYPGLFASLVTGNAVVVKPHPRAVLPLAITVAVVAEVLTEAGFDPNLVVLAAEADGEGIASTLATRPEVRIIDFTGSSEYGEWLEGHAPQAQVYTEKAGVNSVVIDSWDDLKAMCGNIAFSLALYSGQMCTTPQNLLVRRDKADGVAQGLASALNGLLGDDARAVEILGAVVNDGVLERLGEAPKTGVVLVASREVRHPTFAEATVRTPVIVRLDAADAAVYSAEHFGPIAFLISTDSTEASMEIWRRTATEHGALTASVYSTDSAVLDQAERVAWDVGVALSCNLTGGVFVNQSAAFSDFHATGANPAANSTLTDAAYVAGRFRVVQSRRPAA
ncbi:MAG: phenylacetic acid degradation protein PaaN [Frankiaceae bacterium]